MKKIPALYRQLHTKEEIIEFSDQLKFFLMSNFKNYFSLMEYNPQLLVDNSFLYKKRFISFDNIHDTKIYHLLEYCDIELIKLLHSNSNLKKGLISFYNAIERDKQNSFIKNISEYKMLLVKKILLIEANNEIIIKFTKEIINFINEIIDNINLHDTRLIPKKLEIYDFRKIKQIYPTISIKDAINELLSDDKAILIFDMDITFDHINRKEILTFLKNATLYVKSSTNNMTIDLFSFYICPKIEQVMEKFKYSTKNNNDIKWLSTIFNKYNDLLCMEINYTKLLMYVLNKMHIYEINNSPISEDVLNDFIVNKLFRW